MNAQLNSSHLRLVSDASEELACSDHADRAAKIVVDLLNLWKQTLTHQMPVETVSRLGLGMVTAHLQAVEANAIARLTRDLPPKKASN